MTRFWSNSKISFSNNLKKINSISLDKASKYLHGSRSRSCFQENLMSASTSAFTSTSASTSMLSDKFNKIINEEQGWPKSGFLKKNQPGVFFWVLLGFIVFFWVLLILTCIFHEFWSLLTIKRNLGEVKVVLGLYMSLKCQYL